MAKNVVIKKTNKEHTQMLLRQFTQAVRSTGIIPHLRKIRYRARNASHFTIKKAKLHKLAKKAEYERLLKEGKIQARAQRGSWKK